MSASAVPEQALRDTLLALTAIASPIGEEQALCDAVERRLRASLGEAAVTRHEHSLVVHAAPRPGLPRIGLIGHLDTVRTEHDGPARIDGERLYGAGAADMKSGLAVMIELSERLERASLPCDLTLVFYEREEGPFEENMLGPLLERFDALRQLDLAICLEPSDNKLQLGCMGSVHATVRFLGRTSHSARPWQGENAITGAADFLALLRDRAPNDVVLDGHHFREVVSPTMASGGRGRNIIPDSFEINVNYRFAPGRTPEQVVDELRALVRECAGDRAELVPTDLSPAGRPHASHPLVLHLRDCGVSALETKQAWTDVARFDAAGVPAVNFGPGTQAQAHQRNEYTELPPLYAGYAILERFLSSVPAPA
ncbi:succinyl-diaminopimelate desuccinylase [Haliangium ochraceum]|uniref:Succinyl-diaminopimelate desuccinylase n=1 Tax=Haliangium ochraceum (strain DSM 14365 / JCM 11303 / SMP-2) TaxID=502025 RepID=D0LXK1_HALO1|nr:succinyl-diaminopimelate desuccinylase [Haliangium ochraceum]ACY17756.1 peptidase M20 [Haliangium ochraceum DSM 14365]